VAKFSYRMKKQVQNLVMEVGAQTRKMMIHRKIELGRQICKIEEYVVATRCFKCSRFNHRHNDCRGEETCPLCARPHKLKECTAEQGHTNVSTAQHTINTAQIKTCVNHSSLDKKCPSLQAILEKCQQNTDY
jgi:hypothetical protein